MRLRWGSALSASVLVVSALALSVPAANATAPSNDGFASASAITALGTTPGTTVGATPEAGEPSTSNGNAPQGTVWYAVTLSSSQPVTVSASNGQDVEVFSQTGSGLGGLQRLSPLNDGSVAAFQATGGTTYYVRVDVPSSSTPGPFVLTLRAGATVAGTVTDAAGHAVAGVSVYADDAAAHYLAYTTTDGSGHFSQAVPPGSYSVLYAYFGGDPSVNVLPALRGGDVFTADPNHDASWPATAVTTSSPLDASIQLQRGGTVTGKVSVPAGANATQDSVEYDVQVGGAFGGPSLQAFSVPLNADGTFTLNGVWPGVGELYGSWSAISSAHAFADYDGNQAAPVHLVAIGRGCAISGLNLTVDRSGVATATGRPAISCPGTVTPTATLVDANGDGHPDAGDKIHYTVGVADRTFVPIAGVTVTSRTVTLGGGVGSLAAGASGNAVGDYTLTAADIAAGRVSTTFSVNGTHTGTEFSYPTAGVSATNPVWVDDVTSSFSIPACVPSAAQHARLAHDRAALKALVTKLKKARKAHQRSAVKRLTKQQTKLARAIAADLAAIARTGC